MRREPKKPLKSQVFEELKEKIISCEYLPGTSLHEALLCQQLGVSRTPVRDALSRLEQEGLVVIHPKKGFQISGVSISAVNDIYEIRSLIEPYAIEHFGSRLGDDVYAVFLNQFSQPKEAFTDKQLFDLDNRFHQQFFDVSNNVYLQKIHTQIEDQTARFRVLSARYGRLNYTQNEHQKIASMCLQRDWKGAAEAMRNHIEMSKRSIMEYILTSSVESTNIFAVAGES